MELHNSVDWHSRWKDTKNDKFVNFEIENEKMKNAFGMVQRGCRNLCC